jgi:bacterioferritin-associated ferredoxin
MTDKLKKYETVGACGIDCGNCVSDAEYIINNPVKWNIYFLKIK